MWHILNESLKQKVIFEKKCPEFSLTLYFMLHTEQKSYSGDTRTRVEAEVLSNKSYEVNVVFSAINCVIN